MSTQQRPTSHDLVRGLDAGSAEQWEDEVRGRIAFRTLFSKETTATSGLVAGVAQVEPGDEFKPHRHPQTEVYLVIAGKGAVRLDDEEIAVQTGTAVFLPSDRVHGVRNTGESPLRLFYVLDADAMDEVQYDFEPS